MKQLLTTALICVLGLFSYGQTITINVSGHVENSDGTAVEGINIYIATDSSLIWQGYYNTVQTDMDGNYTDAFEAPSAASQGIVWVSMDDCNNTFQTETVYWSPATNALTADFLYCDLSDDCSVNIVQDSLQGTGQGLYAAVAYNGDISYLWSTGETTQDIFIAESGTYCVTIMDSAGCSDSDCIEIDFNANNCGVTVETTAIGSIGANGQGVAPFTYSWSTGELTEFITPNANGTYCVTLTDAEGCTSADCIYYGSPQDTSCYVLIIQGQGADPDILTAIGSGNGPFAYVWSTSESTASIIPNGPGNYCVTLTDSAGCSSSDCFYIGNPQDSSCYVVINETQGLLEAIGSGTAPFTYSWSTGELTSTIQASSPGTYCVTLTDATGCTSSDCFIVVSNDPDNYNLSGYLFLADSNQIVQIEGTVYLFSIEQNDEVTLVDSVDFSSTPIGLVGYSFGDVAAGDYLVLATLDTDSPESENYLPTYYGNSLWWDEATVITIPYLGWASYDIFFIEGNAPEGPGFIGGSVIDMGFTGENPIDRDDPLAFASILLLNEFDEPLANTQTDAEGGFEFADLAWGTYKVYLEVPGMEQQFVEVTIGPDNPQVRDIEFEVEGTTVTSLIEIQLEETLSVYPNPVREQLNVFIRDAVLGEANLFISDLNGKQYAANSLTINAKSQVEVLNVSILPAGIYFLSLNQLGKNTTVRFVKF